MASKIDEYMKGRTEGMEFALRIVKQDGIEALEKEVRFRNRTGISLNATTKELDAASEKIKAMTVDTVMIMGAAALHDLYGFGHVRCQRFIDKMLEGAAYLLADLSYWEDYRREVNEQLGLNLQIRWND